MEFVTVFLDQLSSLTGFIFLGLVFWLLWMNGIIQKVFLGSKKDEADFVKSIRIKEEQYLRAAEQKAELLSMIRNGVYGEILQQSVDEIEKEIMMDGKQRTIKFDQAIYLAQKLGNQMSVDETGGIVIRQISVDAERNSHYLKKDEEQLTTSRGWRNTADTNRVLENKSYDEDRGNVSSISHQVVSQDVSKPFDEKSTLSSETTRSLADAERDIFNLVSLEPWFKECLYFNGETDGVEWYRHPTYQMCKVKVLEDGAIKMVTPYGYSILKKGLILKQVTFGKKSEDEEDGVVVYEEKKITKPLKKETPAPKKVEEPKSKNLSSADDMVFDFGETIEGMTEMINSESKDPDKIKIWANGLIALVLNIILKNDRLFVYTHEQKQFVALSSFDFLEAMETTKEIKNIGQIVESMKHLEESNNEKMTLFLDALNKFICCHFGLDLIDERNKLFYIGKSKSTHKLFGVYPMIFKKLNPDETQIFHIKKASIINMHILQRIIRGYDNKEAISKIAKEEVFNPYALVCFGSKQVDKYFSLRI